MYDSHLHTQLQKLEATLNQAPRAKRLAMWAEVDRITKLLEIDPTPVDLETAAPRHSTSFENEEDFFDNMPV